MEIVWDNDKNDWLKEARGISFEQIAAKLPEDDYLDIVEHPARKKQMYFVMRIRNYTWLVSFLIDEKDRIVLKTAFPSRKYHRRYGEKL